MDLNQEIDTKPGAGLWGKRRVQYFVFDSRSELFAPSKFCAFMGIPDAGVREMSVNHMGMNMLLYASLDTPSERLFDGAKAHNHLGDTLKMSKHPHGELPVVDAAFEQWIEKRAPHINVDS